MSILRKFIHTVAVAAFLMLLTLLHKLNTDLPLRASSGVEIIDEALFNTSDWSSLSEPGILANSPSGTLSTNNRHWTPKDPGANYSRTIVVPCLRKEDISWISDELPGIATSVYVADDPTARLHPPRNKGHEVMVYLTYIIDHYFDLPDTIIFIHAHRWAHHNIELLGHDSAEMVKRLSNEYVAREGYVNLRCQWSPGCPTWLRPQDTGETLAKQEQIVLSQCWNELFPSQPLPEALGQACCAQFALSKERVLSISLGHFIFYRDWMLTTPLSDYISGRIWEYLWQFLFTGNGVHCPSEDSCHCQGFGICFGGDVEYRNYEGLRRAKEGLELELRHLREQQAGPGSEGAREKAVSENVFTGSDRYLNLSTQAEALGKEILARQQRAFEGGTNQENVPGDASGLLTEHIDF